jgi:hypothetical protein
MTEMKGYWMIRAELNWSCCACVVVLVLLCLCCCACVVVVVLLLVLLLCCYWVEQWGMQCFPRLWELTRYTFQVQFCLPTHAIMWIMGQHCIFHLGKCVNGDGRTFTCCMLVVCLMVFLKWDRLEFKYWYTPSMTAFTPYSHMIKD